MTFCRDNEREVLFRGFVARHHLANTRLQGDRECFPIVKVLRKLEATASRRHFPKQIAKRLKSELLRLRSHLTLRLISAAAGAEEWIAQILQASRGETKFLCPRQLRYGRWVQVPSKHVLV
jgi:hypothetical protein